MRAPLLILFVLLSTLSFGVLGCDSGGGQEVGDREQLEVEQEQAGPVCHTDLAVGEKVVFADGFDNGTEGIAFDGLGGMYISHGHTVTRVGSDGAWAKVADLHKALGMAFDVSGDLIVASTGEVFDKVALDGTVSRVSPTGALSLLLDVGTIKNPNFVTRTPWGTWLVSDDYVPEIWELTDDGVATIWSGDIVSPNGMVFSADGATLYVANTFFKDDANVYAIPVTDGAAGLPTLYATLTEGGANDGVALDVEGNLYIAANTKGKIIRVSPLGEQTTIAEELFTPASIAFGKGEGFDPCSIYVTELTGIEGIADRIWRISLGVAGQPLYE